ncbi:hypothetical protein HY639_04380 [Candidatus Woesearchaeota archaeon]|nr:hypothetical protein [Candidatus Woesearchaeota archaeon]
MLTPVDFSTLDQLLHAEPLTPQHLVDFLTLVKTRYLADQSKVSLWDYVTPVDKHFPTQGSLHGRLLDNTGIGIIGVHPEYGFCHDHHQSLGLSIREVIFQRHTQPIPRASGITAGVERLVGIPLRCDDSVEHVWDMIDHLTGNKKLGQPRSVFRDVKGECVNFLLTFFLPCSHYNYRAWDIGQAKEKELDQTYQSLCRDYDSLFDALQTVPGFISLGKDDGILTLKVRHIVTDFDTSVVYFSEDY